MGLMRDIKRTSTVVGSSTFEIVGGLSKLSVWAGIGIGAFWAFTAGSTLIPSILFAIGGALGGGLAGAICKPVVKYAGGIVLGTVASLATSAVMIALSPAILSYRMVAAGFKRQPSSSASWERPTPSYSLDDTASDDSSLKSDFDAKAFIREHMKDSAHLVVDEQPKESPAPRNRGSKMDI